MEKKKRITQIKQFIFIGGVLLFIGIFIVVTYPSTLSRFTRCDTSLPRPILNQNVHAELLWTECVGIEAGTQAILAYEDSLIIADYTRNALVSFNINSGVQQWTAPIEGMRNLTFDNLRDRIYTSTIDGNLREIYAIDPKTGTIIWRNGVQNGKRDGYSPILLANGELIAYAILSETVRKLDADSGELGETISTVSLHVYADGYAWTIQDRYLTAIDAINGEVFWRATDPVTHCCMWDVQTNDGIVLAQLGADLAAYDLETGKLLWNTTDLKIVGRAALTTDTVYALDLAAKLHIFNLYNGTEEGYIQFQPPASGHDTDLLAGDSISSSLIAATDKIIAVYFGDTDMLSVYNLER